MVVGLKTTPDQLKVIAVYLLLLVFYAAYLASGVEKRLIIYIVPCVFVYIELTTPIAAPFFYVFRTILPGGPSQDPSFLKAAAAAFFGSGLMEELMKAVPALICLAVRSAILNTPARHHLDSIPCSTPLDGILLGLAAGAGFVYFETFHQIASDGTGYAWNQDGPGTGILFQKLRQGVIGHMAWSGIFGFFIGLSARYPRSTLILLVAGWLSAAALHTLWNLSPYLGEITRWIKNGLSLMIFIVCFIKAKQLDAST